MHSHGAPTPAPQGGPPGGLDTFLTGLWKENPIFVQVLGMCPTLAVSNSVVNAVSMGFATLFVLVMSNLAVSLVRNLVPEQIRMATYIVIIATFVTVAEYLLQAISLEVYQALGAYVPLIVVNCIILGRAEAFASKNPPLPSLVDALGNGLGFVVAISVMGTVREVLGSGTFMGWPVFGERFEPWVIFVLPGGGFFVLGALMLGVVAINNRMKRGAS